MSGLAPGAPDVEPEHPAPPETDLSPIADAVTESDAAGLVAVGDRFDDDLRWLSRFGGPDRAYAVVVTTDRAALTAPGLFDDPRPDVPRVLLVNVLVATDRRDG